MRWNASVFLLLASSSTANFVHVCFSCISTSSTSHRPRYDDFETSMFRLRLSVATTVSYNALPVATIYTSDAIGAILREAKANDKLILLLFSSQITVNPSCRAPRKTVS